MRGSLRSFRVVQVVLLLVIAGIIGATGWYVWSTKEKADKSIDNSLKISDTASTISTASSTKVFTPKSNDEDQIADALLRYCKTDYKKIWEDTYKVSTSEASISSIAKNPVIKEGFGRVDNASCDTNELRSDQKFSGFIAFFKKINEEWTLYTKDQQTPACSKFDGQGWPSEIVPSCYGNNNQNRSPQ